MIRFLLNREPIQTDQPAGLSLLDYIRYHAHLKGTKIGCREGDCGACTVLIGEWVAGRLRYRSATSCLTSLGNISNKHVVTIEGLNGEGLNPIQAAICEEGGTQCGFCTPGFVVSVTGFCMGEGVDGSIAGAVAAVDGNICRCTGYKPIERALSRVVALMRDRGEADVIPWLIGQGILSAWFGDAARLLWGMVVENVVQDGGGNGVPGHDRDDETEGALGNAGAVGNGGAVFLGGGTDLYVQRHEQMPEAKIHLLFNHPSLKGIRQLGGICEIGGAATVTDLVESPVIRRYLPDFPGFASLISSTPIRNIATVAGNFVNASPIGDLSVFFLAMDAELQLSDGVATRRLSLREFFLGYKQLNKRPEEWIEAVRFRLPAADEYIHFEKVSKRTHLDIASVNTAIRLRLNSGIIEECSIAAGGVASVPLYLASAASAMRGRRVDESMVVELVRLVRSEVRPISDARGTAAYKSLLLGQLIKAHFLHLFPVLGSEVIL